MARIHGRYGQIELGTPAEIVGSVQKWTLNSARDYVDVTCFGDPNKVYVPGLRDISGSIAFVYNLDVGIPAAGDSEAIFAAAESPDPVEVKLTPSSLDVTHHWSGPAYLDVQSLDVDVKGAVTGVSNFKASGAWTRA